jgi:WbqC-like protein family
MHSPAVLIDLHYLPSLEYFCALYPFEKIVLERQEHFVKQSFRNRCHIHTSQGKQMLIVPVTEKHGKISMGEIKIDNNQKWQNNHWRAIESSYRKAPFFEFYSDDLKGIIYKNHELLFELNKDLLSFCLRTMKIKVEVSESVSFEKTYDEAVLDLRGQISAKTSYDTRTFYHAVPYQQVFGNGFAENLSFLDLLFCEGPNSLKVIGNSVIWRIG